MEALRISPRFSSNDWRALDKSKPEDWLQAAAIVRDRLEGRFLRFVDSWISDPFSGFIVLAIDSLLAEALQQFRNGATSGDGKSEKYIKAFLSGSRFAADFDGEARTRFFEDIRCGLLHQAEAREMWLVRRNQKRLLQRAANGRGYIIDVELFHRAVRSSFEDYLKELQDPSQGALRTKLWTKMDYICRVREARGLLYEDMDQVAGLPGAT